RCVIAIYVMVRASGRSGLVATPSELCHERGGHRELKGHAGSPQATTRHGGGWASPTPRSAALCAIDPEHPLHLLDAGPVRPGDVAGDREAPAPHDLLEAGTRRVGVGVHAEDEAAPRRDDVGEQMVDEVAATARRPRACTQPAASPEKPDCAWGVAAPRYAGPMMSATRACQPASSISPRSSASSISAMSGPARSRKR